MSSVSFDDGSAQVEFINNKIQIKREDPCLKRDQLILNSVTGVLLALSSISCAVFSLIKLLPAMYSSSCHTKNTWAMSAYPGANFALIESLISIAFLALLIQAAIFTVILSYVPKFFLRTVPTSIKHYNSRMHSYWDPTKAWKPV